MCKSFQNIINIYLWPVMYVNQTNLYENNSTCVFVYVKKLPIFGVNQRFLHNGLSHIIYLIKWNTSVWFIFRNQFGL